MVGQTTTLDTHMDLDELDARVLTEALSALSLFWAVFCLWCLASGSSLLVVSVGDSKKTRS